MQRHDALRMNIAGRQRMLSQSLVKNLYECRYGTCDYSELRTTLTRLMNINTALQSGNDAIGLRRLEDSEIKLNFNKLKPSLNAIYAALNDFNNLKYVSIENLNVEVDNYLALMERIVNQFQKSSENDLKTLMIVEFELAVFSLVILLLEIFFVINPTIKKITLQNVKLKEISWHQTYAFNSHMTNIKKLKHVIDIEKRTDYKEDLIDCVMSELKDLEEVSNNMINALDKQEE